MTWSKEQMADKLITLFKPNTSVNLGIGFPTLIAERIPAHLNIMIHSENGVIGISGRPTKKTVSPTLINAGKETVSIRTGASFFDSSLSFGMIRGGHIDYCILGGMEVDVSGNLANWMVPGKKITGMGGAMDLVNGAKTVMIMMTHFSKDGKSKLLKECTLPLTGLHVVNLVITELGLFKPLQGKFIIEELADSVLKKDLGIDNLI